MTRTRKYTALEDLRLMLVKTARKLADIQERIANGLDVQATEERRTLLRMKVLMEMLKDITA